VSSGKYKQICFIQSAVQYCKQVRLSAVVWIHPVQCQYDPRKSVNCSTPQPWTGDSKTPISRPSPSSWNLMCMCTSRLNEDDGEADNLETGMSASGRVENYNYKLARLYDALSYTYWQPLKVSYHKWYARVAVFQRLVGRRHSGMAVVAETGYRWNRRTWSCSSQNESLSEPVFHVTLYLCITLNPRHVM